MKFVFRDDTTKNFRYDSSYLGRFLFVFLYLLVLSILSIFSSDSLKLLHMEIVQ